MNELVKLSRDGEVAVITVDNPPVNALSRGVPEGIERAIGEIAGDDRIKAAVLIGADATFIAGADIREFAKFTQAGANDSKSMLPLMLAMEDCPKLIVAAIHGTAYGGGLEVAQGAHYRVAAPSALLGQPEVKLGIIPGAAGTQRLPRLVGAEKAVEMCAFGEPVTAQTALEIGLIDRLIEGNLLSGAIEFAREKAAENTAPPKTRERADKLRTSEDYAAIFSAAREKARRTKRGMNAPLAAIEAVEAATKMPFAEGCQLERDLFFKQLSADESKSLIHVFFAERAAAKIPDVPKDTPVLEIKRAAVIGAGTMGGGIAMSYANAGIPVILKETTREALDRGVSIIRKNYANSVKKGRFSQEEMERRISLITPQLNYDGFETADIVTEAVFEGMALKKEIFGALDKICKPEAILASNTSTLDIDEIASATSHPQMVIGHHFFSPANVMRLLEVVRGRETSVEVIATSLQLAKKLKKIGVLVGNCHGFVGNRMIASYGREAQFLLEEGATVEQVDNALKNFGWAMGILAVDDLAGIDVGWRIRQETRHLRDPHRRYPLVVDKLYELGRYGQKTGAGWYDYDENRQAQPNSEIALLVRETAKVAGIEQREISDREIIERTMYALVNEGAKILEEGFALRSSDIDLIYINGYGYPAWRGGPIFYADTIGLEIVYERIVEFERQHGVWWRPANLLKELAEGGKRFADFDRANLARTSK